MRYQGPAVIQKGVQNRNECEWDHEHPSEMKYKVDEDDQVRTSFQLPYSVPCVDAVRLFQHTIRPRDNGV